MVKSEDVPDRWREVFEGNRWVPAHSQTVRLAADSRLGQSGGFQLGLRRVTAPHLPQVTAPSGGLGVRSQRGTAARNPFLARFLQDRDAL